MRSTRVRSWTRTTALGGAAVLLLAGTAACGGGGDDESGGGGDSGSAASEGAGGDGGSGDAAEAVRAAADSADGTRSAAFDATLTGSDAMGGEVRFSGDMAWGDEPALDATIEGAALGGGGTGAPDSLPVLWQGDTMWADLGDTLAESFDGRHWLRIDLAELAEEAERDGDDALARGLADGMATAAQDPGRQIALLLSSPEIESAGEEEVGGEEAEHYRGTVTVEEALSAGGGDGLTEEQREQLTETAEQQGIDSYTIDVWVNEDDFPVRLRQEYETNAGPVTYEITYSDFGTEVDVQPPVDGETVSIAELAESSSDTQAG
ncbi:hypothetical protein [Streptomyces sp. RFCAC02]|uniref:hypothetical protein n=1 Tax=Streptomyces sp. RFCAC02 TaxID=2499143 RepID=UPI00101EBBD6|nr:hypothetical protein [Streptomyces sp. RFCAC02]